MFLSNGFGFSRSISYAVPETEQGCERAGRRDDDKNKGLQYVALPSSFLDEL